MKANVLIPFLLSAISFAEINFPKWGSIGNDLEYSGEFLGLETLAAFPVTQFKVEYRPLVCDWVKSDSEVCSFEYLGYSGHNGWWINASA